MNYHHFFSDDVASFYPSPTREIFRKVDLSKIYSFSGGYPPAESFPRQEMIEACREVLSQHGGEALQYGATSGLPRLISLIAERYGEHSECVQITTSSQQGIDVCTRVLINPGDTILTTSPTYLGALQSFRSYRANIVGVAYSDNLEEFRINWKVAAKKASNAKFIYIIPDFQNPSGQTLSLAQRQVLIDIAKAFDLLIVEDCPYRELRYHGQHQPTIRSLCPERTLQLGTFSKILAPGLRLGWMLGPEEVIRQVYICKQSLDLCPPVFDQWVAAKLLEDGVVDRCIDRNIMNYSQRLDTMLSLLEKYMPQGVTWTHPEGGLFVYLTVPDIDTVALYEKALSAGVAYVAGSFFEPSPEVAPKTGMRLNFSFIPLDKMSEGIKLLADIITQ